MKIRPEDPKEVNKYDLVLDIVEHPEKYPADRLREILSDSETREIYNLLCMADSAVEAEKETDVDAEWERFAQRQSIAPRRRFSGLLGSRAAGIAAIIFTSVVAVAAGIAVTVAVGKHLGESAADKTETREVAAVTAAGDSLIQVSDSLRAMSAPILFEDKSLEEIMEEVSRIYGIKVSFLTKEVASLHLYYRLDPSLPLDEIVSQLNTFEQLHIRHEDNSLIITETIIN